MAEMGAEKKKLVILIVTIAVIFLTFYFVLKKILGGVSGTPLG